MLLLDSDDDRSGSLHVCSHTFWFCSNDFEASVYLMHYKKLDCLRGLIGNPSFST